MTDENDLKLCAAFPRLYRYRYGLKRVANQHYGFEVGDGWYDIIYNLSRNIQDYVDKYPELKNIYFTQVKEKFGEARIYMSSSNEDIDLMIEEATDKSAHTCEVCGKPAKTKNINNWLSTICNTCRKAHEATQQEMLNGI